MEYCLPEGKARLAELYPQDKATGYAEGQLRGALTVKRPLQSVEGQRLVEAGGSGKLQSPYRQRRLLRGEVLALSVKQFQVA